MLRSLDKISLKYPHSDFTYDFDFDGTKLHVSADGKPAMLMHAEVSQDTLRLKIEEFQNVAKSGVLLGVGIEYFFSHFPNLAKVEVQAPADFLKDPVLKKWINGESFEINREVFYQQPWAWHRIGEEHSPTELWTETHGRKHPVRPRMGPGRHYSRYVPALGKTISFRTVDIDRDLEIFHDWHNQPRVYDLWELNKPINDLREYLEKGLKDPHQIPLIVEFDDQPVGYFEIYWAAEDRIGPYYDYLPYDRGFHFLIGNPKFLGKERTDQILRSVAHFIFLDDSRTQNIVAEPRADNKKVIKYVQITPGWHFVKEFDFPHKRAALLMQIRKDFFKKDTL